MRKQEWISEQVRRHANSIMYKDRMEDIIRRAIEEGVNHPEFGPDKPVYTYSWQDCYPKGWKYTIYKDGVVFDSSNFPYDRSQCIVVAQAIIEVLNCD